MSGYSGRLEKYQYFWPCELRVLLKQQTPVPNAENQKRCFCRCAAVLPKIEQRRSQSPELASTAWLASHSRGDASVSRDFLSRHDRGAGTPVPLLPPARWLQGEAVPSPCLALGSHSNASSILQPGGRIWEWPSRGAQPGMLLSAPDM